MITLAELLNNYTPTPEELATKTRMRTLLKECPDCFERSRAGGHFTSSAWLINHDGTQALLMHHTKLGQWFQLGGHCDGNHDMHAVAIKEAQEESGINDITLISTSIFDIDIHHIPTRGATPEHDHYDVRFLLRAGNDTRETKNSESQELRWINKDPAQLPTKSCSVTRMFEKWLDLPSMHG